MPLLPQIDSETLIQSGGLILEQLVAAHVISPKQRRELLDEQATLARDTGEKPFIGTLLEKNGIATADLMQPLLALQASSRILLYAHGHMAAAQQAEAGFGAINLQEGVPDNSWTLSALENTAQQTSDAAAQSTTEPAINHAAERTALLQTRLLQTKLLATAATLMEENNIAIPPSTLSALRASQDAGREGFAAALDTLEAIGRNTASLDAAFASLPPPSPPLTQREIQNGIHESINQLQQHGLLTPEQANTLHTQEARRGNDIMNLQSRRQARHEAQAQQPAVDGTVVSDNATNVTAHAANTEHHHIAETINAAAPAENSVQPTIQYSTEKSASAPHSPDTDALDDKTSNVNKPVVGTATAHLASERAQQQSEKAPNLRR